MRDELWRRLREDPEFLRQCVEEVIGSPTSSNPTSSGFTEYHCPFPGCGGGAHFGVCYHPTGRFPLGSWSCFKCSSKGLGFPSLCRNLGVNPESIVDLVSQGQIEKRLPIKPPGRPVTLKEFSQVWRTAVEEYRLSEEHERMLLERGIEGERCPPWFTIPDLHKRFLRFHGQSLCEQSSVVRLSSEKPTYFSEPGRLALVYPRRPWREDGNEIFIASYQQQSSRKILRPRGLSLEGLLYYRGFPSREHKTLVITEGEIKAEVSYQAGVPTLGLLGVSTGHREVVECLRYLRDQYGFPERIVFAFDRDVKPTAIEPVRKSLERLRRTIQEDLGSECPPLDQILFPESETKVDIDSYIGQLAARNGLDNARHSYRRLIDEHHSLA